MKKSLEESLSQSLKFNRVRQKVHSLIPETNSMQILTDKEIADGFILTCQAHATTPTIKVDFDDV